MIVNKIELPKGLYGITSENVSIPYVDQVKIMIKKGAKIIQYRDKKSDNRKFGIIAKKIKKICDNQGVIFIVNDRIEIAKRLNANIHIGINDGNPLEIKKELKKILGYSVNDKNINNFKKIESCIDYIGLGPIFPSKIKSEHKPFGIKKAKKVIKKSKVPVYCIGGIYEDNLDDVLEINPHGICISFFKFVKFPNLVKKIKKFYNKQNKI